MMAAKPLLSSVRAARCGRVLGFTFWLGATAIGIHAQDDKTPPPPNAKAGAPIDFTGQWVAVVTEDWRWRMVTPAKGDFTSIPLNEAGQKIGDAWDPAKDEAAGLQCKAYAAPSNISADARPSANFVGGQRHAQNGNGRGYPDADALLQGSEIERRRLAGYIKSIMGAHHRLQFFRRNGFGRQTNPAGKLLDNGTESRRARWKW